jgi:hypothetical protein
LRSPTGTLRIQGVDIMHRLLIFRILLSLLVLGFFIEQYFDFFYRIPGIFGFRTETCK